MKRNKKRGMTVAEAVVALAVITIVSIAAISVIRTTTDVTARTVFDNNTRTLAENALEAFKFAEDEDEFVSAMQEPNMKKQHTGEYRILDNDQLAVQIFLIYPEDGRPLIRVYGYYVDGREAFCLVYEKG